MCEVITPNVKLRGVPFTDGERSPKAWIFTKLKTATKRHVPLSAVLGSVDFVGADGATPVDPREDRVLTEGLYALTVFFFNARYSFAAIAFL
jgi:hypothetical protein